MGEFFEDLGKRITETAEVVTKKTEEVVEIQKIKSQIRVMERNNERDFKDIGKIIYDRFKKGEVLNAKVVELCEAIESREESIETYIKEVAERKGVTVCSNCKGQLAKEMIYCPKCGTKVEEDIFEEEFVVEPEPEDVEECEPENVEIQDITEDTAEEE